MREQSDGRVAKLFEFPNHFVNAGLALENCVDYPGFDDRLLQSVALLEVAADIVLHQIFHLTRDAG